MSLKEFSKISNSKLPVKNSQQFPVKLSQLRNKTQLMHEQDDFTIHDNDKEFRKSRSKLNQTILKSVMASRNFQ